MPSASWFEIEGISREYELNLSLLYKEHYDNHGPPRDIAGLLDMIDFLAPLRLKQLQGVDVDSPLLVAKHREILADKPLLLQVFREFYDACKHLDAEHLTPGEGYCIELGSGSSLFSDYYPDVLATDLKPCEGHDRALDAMEMDLPDESVHAFYLINAFHHLPDPSRFFSEIRRTLQPGGGCVLIDCYYGPLAALFYRRLFPSEGFDKDEPRWTRDDRAAMQGANQALSYIVFERDAAQFAAQFPELKIVYRQTLNNYVRYIASGGLNFGALVPNAAAPVLRGIEALLTPLARLLSLHHVVVIRKE